MERFDTVCVRGCAARRVACGCGHAAQALQPELEALGCGWADFMWAVQVRRAAGGGRLPPRGFHGEEPVGRPWTERALLG